MALNINDRKSVGAFGEAAAEAYLRCHNFRIDGRNIARKTGELDIVAQKADTLHIIEVKTIVCEEFPSEDSTEDGYRPENNLHSYKIHKVIRTAEWYIAERDWEGESQVDGILVWVRRRDKMVKVYHLSQIGS